jgi:hypothetical protein
MGIWVERLHIVVARTKKLREGVTVHTRKPKMGAASQQSSHLPGILTKNRHPVQTFTTGGLKCIGWDSVSGGQNGVAQRKSAASARLLLDGTETNLRGRML